MSSVQGGMKCPKCGGVMVYEFDCNTREEHRNCYRCGLAQDWELLRNDDGTVKTKDDGTWLGKFTESPGYGALLFMGKNGVGCSYGLQQPLTEEEKTAVLADMQAPEIDTSSSYAVMYDPDSGEFTLLAGKLPEAYEEDEEGQDETL